MRKLLRRPSPATIIATAAFAVAVGGAAYATIPDSSGTIHACYNKVNGNARLVSSADQCRTNERSASWAGGGGGNAHFHAGQDGPKPYGQTVTLAEIPGFLRIETTCEEEPDEQPGEDLKRITHVLENLQASADLRFLTGFGTAVPAILGPGETVTHSFRFVQSLPSHLLTVVDFNAFGGAGRAAQGRVFMTLTNDTCSGEFQAVSNF